MNRNDVSRGVVDAESINFGLGIVGLESIICAIALGVWAHSWWVFGGVLIALLILIYIKKVAMVLFVLFTIGWGIGIGILAHWIFNSVAAGIVLGIIALIVSGGAHMWASEWMHNKQS